MSVELPAVEGLTPDQVMTLVRARKYEQFVQMLEAYRRGICIFCDPLGPKNVVISEAGGWRMWVNPFPEKHTKLHLVMAPRRHVAPDMKITVADFTDMGILFDYARNKLYPGEIRGGGVVMRFGLSELNAGTILHLHANILVPDLSGEVRVPLAKEPEKVQEELKRFEEFMERYSSENRSL